MDPQKLHELRCADPPKEDRVDICTVPIDMEAPVGIRAQRFVEQIKNPYAFMCGDLAVNIEFTPGGRRLRDAIVSFLSAKVK